MNTPTSQEEGAQVSRHSLGQTQRDTDTSATEPPNPRPTAQASSNSQTSGQLSRAQSLFAELLTIEEFQLPPSARAAIQASYPEFTNLLVRPSSTSVSQQVPLSTGHAQASKAIVPESSRSRQLAPKPSQASSTPSSGQPNPNLRLPPSAPVAIQSSNPQLAAWLVPPPSTSNFQQSALTPNYAPTSSAMLPESLRSHKPGPHQSQTFAASSSRQPSPNHVRMRTTTPPAAPLRPPNRPDLSLEPSAPILPSAPASPTPPTTTTYTPVAAGICGEEEEKDDKEEEAEKHGEEDADEESNNEVLEYVTYTKNNHEERDEEEGDKEESNKEEDSNVDDENVCESLEDDIDEDNDEIDEGHVDESHVDEGHAEKNDHDKNNGHNNNNSTTDNGAHEPYDWRRWHEYMCRYWRGKGEGDYCSGCYYEGCENRHFAHYFHPGVIGGDYDFGDDSAEDEDEDNGDARGDEDDEWGLYKPPAESASGSGFGSGSGDLSDGMLIANLQLRE
ncbi:hypothetical protein SMACR_09449 [Sordaria macrospora]|uniref:WGS project CABT00000000 data, contig 2.92 n=2 Tax=Sordaria macrospora TaxID=5147 RepID=F7WC16_SORMK|nr:uncharacterized protein SMAC_09449 [Sordaria macrospora k-hell]KAA8624296.1 hypothetical protein SMACR_09449 [Sordaria macrospora]WPJ62864.1 hypothetical protein SMAC4_09449 [Sordaria macrospora]CCC05519.1 unnamed protein product [Sordaria macrospora k-hell]